MMTKRSDGNDNDDNKPVGYGRPPKRHRFKPGKSGNPRGRPRKSQSLENAILAELRKSITITENGKARRVTKVEALGMSAVGRALKGDHRLFVAVAAILARDEQHKAGLAQQTTRFTLNIGDMKINTEPQTPDDDDDDEELI